MSGYSITVVRDDYRRVSIVPRQDDLSAVVSQSLDQAQRLARYGCPFGDPRPPRCVEIADAAGDLVLRIAVDESLIAGDPEDPSGRNSH